MSDLKNKAKRIGDSMKSKRSLKRNEVFLSPTIHTDNIIGGQIGYMKIFDNYNDAKEDGDGNEPIPFRTMREV